jgi:hypothetical protein
MTSTDSTNAFAATTVHRQREIAAHFAGRASVAMESAMRAHLPDCAACRRHYERGMLFARLDPQGLTAVDRIGNGLGLRVRPSVDVADAATRGVRARLSSMRLAISAGSAMAVAAMALLLVTKLANVDDRRMAGHAAADTEFASRGSAHVVPGATAAAFWTYRIPAAGPPILVNGAIATHDELAFAYANPAGMPYLMIFGTDEHRHVYWFHPAWPTGMPAPSAIRAAIGPGPHELPAAIRHAFKGRALTVYAVFSEQPIDTQFIEGRIQTASNPDDAAVFGDGVIATRRSFEVAP